MLTLVQGCRTFFGGVSLLELKNNTSKTIKLHISRVFLFSAMADDDFQRILTRFYIDDDLPIPSYFREEHTNFGTKTLKAWV